MDYLNKIKNNQIKNFENLIKNINYEELYLFVDILIKFNKKNIYFIGIGKSGNIAIHLSDLFKSISLKTFHLNALNITHGDLGCIDKDDLVIFFSKSGNAKEILDIIDVFKCYKILICSNQNAKIKNTVDKTFIVPLDYECDIHFGLIPSNSVVNNIIYFNFIFNLYIEKVGIKLDEYKNNHPSGDIGFKTKTISEFVTNDIYVVDNINISIKKTTNLLKDNKMGLVFTCNNKFYGILTNKDIIGIYSNSTDINSILEEKVKNYINTNPFIIEDSTTLISEKIELIQKYKYFKLIPVIDNGIYKGIIDNSKILKYI